MKHFLLTLLTVFALSGFMYSCGNESNNQDKIEEKAEALKNAEEVDVLEEVGKEEQELMNDEGAIDVEKLENMIEDEK